MRALAVASLLLLGSLVPTAAAASNVTTDMLVDVLDADHVLLEETMTEHDQHFSPWTIHVPDNATVVEAHDANGFLANTTNGDGTVTIRTRTSHVDLPYSFTVTFAKAPQAYGALRALLVGVGNAGGTSTLHARLPMGWTLVGEQSQPAMQPDALGVLSAPDSFVGTFAFAPPGIADAGPDGRVQGMGVLREGVANLTAQGGSLALTITYDTGVYGSVGTLVPRGAQLVGASTPFGAVNATVTGNGAEIANAYPFAAGLGARPVTLRFALPPPVPFGGAFLNQTLSMPAGDGDTVALRVHLAPDLRHVATRTSAALDATGLIMGAHAPFVADVAMLPPAPPGFVDFDAGIYHVRVPEALDATVTALALNATAQLAKTSAFARGDAIDPNHPFFLTYTDDASLFRAFAGEEGFYSRGMGTISIRASDLANSTPDHVDFPALSTLVHETTHGLVDRLIPEGYDNLSFFQEGLARLAENHLEKLFPDQVIQTTPGGWTRLSVRPDASDVQTHDQAGDVFPLTWSAQSKGADIGWLYDESGLIFRAYEERSDSGALGRALIQLSQRGAGPNDDADAQAVLQALLNESPRLSAQTLLYPGREVATLPADKFEACMGDLVAPPFPHQHLPPPPSDCGSAPLTQSVSVDAGAPPAQGGGYVPPAPPSPSSTYTRPTASDGGPSPVPVPTGGGALGAGETDAGSKAPPGPGLSVTPGFETPPLVAALGAVALLAARRRLK